MADDLLPPGLDAPRPVPGALRARLEAALLVGLDQPRPMPRPLHGRLTAALLAAPAGGAAVTPPMAVPPPVSPVSAGPGRRLRLLAAAVTLVLGAGLAGLSTVGDGGEPAGEVAAGPRPGPPPTRAVEERSTKAAADLAPAPVVVPTAPPVPALPASPAPAPAPAVVPGPAAPSAAPGSATAPVGPAPPFAFGNPPIGTGPVATSEFARTDGPLAAAAPALAPPTPAPALAPRRVRVIGGDADQEVGFGAYLDLLNRSGGIGGRPVLAVAASQNTGAVATVNLSGEPLGPGSRPGGPLAETLTAPEAVLAGDVFGFSSPPERQARLAVDAMYPAAVPGATALLVTATSGVYATTVADAFEAGLRARGVVVTRSSYEVGPATVPPAEATVFLSLAPAAARAWVSAARPGAATALVGIASLHDPALLAGLPAGTQVVTPYRDPGGAEGDAIRAATGGRAPGAAVLHGWATAKALAVALWRSGADSPAELATALRSLTGYDSRLAPPYEVRPGTRARTPEGLVLEVAGGAFVPRSDFRRDTT